MGAVCACWGVCRSAASGTSCPAARKVILWIAVPAAAPAQLGERQPAVGEGRRAPCSSRGCSSTRRPPHARSQPRLPRASCARSWRRCACPARGACDRAHEVRLTRPDVVLRHYTQNDGSAQPRRGGGHLAVPTGVNRQLLADPVGQLRLGPPVVPAGHLGRLFRLRRAGDAAGAQVVARHSHAGAAPRPLQLGLEQALTWLQQHPRSAEVGSAGRAYAASL